MVGEEPGPKGTPDVSAAGERLRACCRSLGNVEGFDLPAGGADVVVTDGFTGNVALKVIEAQRRSGQRYAAAGPCRWPGGS